MKPFQEAQQLTSINEVEIEIQERRELKSQMVGWLYPILLQNEIDLLIDLKYELMYPNNEGA